MTTFPLSDYAIPGDALEAVSHEDDELPSYDCEIKGKYTYVDTRHLFDKRSIYRWAADTRARPSNDGTITLWANPVIAIKDYKKGAQIGVEYAYSLADWVYARNWKDTSTYESHYNKPLKIKVNGKSNVKVEYKTLSSGEGYEAESPINAEGLPTDFSCNWGSLQNYSSSGLLRTIIGTAGASGTKNWILTGVILSVPNGSAGGSTGKLTTRTGERNIVVPNVNYQLAEDALMDVSAHAADGYCFRNDSSSVYSLLEFSKFRVSAGNITVTYLYSELKTDVKLNSIGYYQGTNAIDHYNTWVFDAGNVMQKGIPVDGESLSPDTVTKYKYVWEMVKGTLYKAKDNILTKPDIVYQNDLWGAVSRDFDLTTESARKNSVNNGNGIVVSNAVTDLTYVGTYQVRAPQIELKYYKDAKGKYHLLSTTSKDAAINQGGLLDSYQRNVWGVGDKASHTVEALIKADVVLDGETINKKMILTNSFAYAAGTTNSLQSYNGSRNCWDAASLPTGGRALSETVYSSDVQTAYDAYLAGQNTRRTTTAEVQPTPLIYVYVYEGGPTMTVQSLYTTSLDSGSVGSNRSFTIKASMSGSFRIGSSKLKMGKVVEYPLGTTSVTVSEAMMQDGVGVQNDALTGEFTFGGTTMYLDKYFSSTDRAIISQVQSWQPGAVMKESALNGVCTTWQYSMNGQKIVFKNGVATLVKSFTPNPSHAFWSVQYADLEDGADTSNPYTSFKGNYQRINLPVYNARSLVAESTGITCPFVDHLELTIEKLLGEWTLVNVGYSKSNGDSVNSDGMGYENEVASNKLSNTNQRAAADYAKENLGGMEQPGNAQGITWAVNPYGASMRSALDFSTSWVNANARIDARRTWVWGIYKADKAYSRVYVLQNKDGTYQLLQGVQQEDLDVYTTKYQVSMQPFLEYQDTVLQLREVHYDYLNGYNEGTIATEAAKWANQFEVTQNEDGAFTGNTNELRLIRKTLYVAGIYTEIDDPDGFQEDFETTEDIIPFRDTDGMQPGASSWNEAESGPIESAVFRGFIRNDTAQSSDKLYDAEQAIPTSEYLKTTAVVPKYLVDVDYLKTVYQKKYSVHCYQGINKVTTSTDAFGNKVTVYDGRLLTDDIPIVRNNYHYSLNGANVWVPEDTTLKNYALPDRLGESITMFADGVTWKNESLGFTRVQDGGISIRDYDDYELRISYGVVNGTSSFDDYVADWSTPEEQESRRLTADGIIEPMTATNAEVTFGDGAGSLQRVLQHTEYRLVVDDPEDPKFADNVPEETFNSKNDNRKDFSEGVTQGDTTKMQIEEPKANGNRASSGVVHYGIAQMTTGGVVYEDKDLTAAGNRDIVAGMVVNGVNLFTPVISTFSLTDQSEWSQKINPGTGQPLVLDKLFTLTVGSVGRHCGLPGYSEKDYSRYYEYRTSEGEKIRTAQVKFPFPVLRTLNGQNVYYKENVWITVDVGETEFLLPSWADEGDAQLIRVRTNAINARTNDPGLGHYEMMANYDQTNYGAYSQKLVEVMGRVYGLSIIDIGDYPLWEDYFRTDGLLNGNVYHSGLANQEGYGLGVNAKYTFPTIAGSHPNVQNAGVLKPGYVIRYKLETVGELYSADDYVQIVPEFYYVSKEDGSRRKVDVYYDEMINGSKQNMVKIGSELDKQNKKKLGLSSGDFSLDGEVLQETARMLGYDSTGDFTNHQSSVYTFGNIMLNQYVRTFVGKRHETILSDSRTMNLWEAGISQLVPEARVSTSVQNWYSTYYLPSSVHATTATEEEVKAATEKGVTYQEDVWLKNGYLLINFTIKTLDGSEYHLAYDAEALNKEASENAEESGELDSEELQEVKVAGDCDMWSVESYVTSKSDSNGNTFQFEEGDFMILDLDAAGATNDYSSGGTH